MTPSKFALLAAVAASLCAAAPAPSPKDGFKRAAWKADFERIKKGLAQGYANLDWQVERRSFNLSAQASKSIPCSTRRTATSKRSSYSFD